MSDLTETEELELLELEEAEASARPVPVSQEPGDLAAMGGAPDAPEAPKDQSVTGKLNSAIRGGAKAATLGWFDEASAGLGSAMTKLPLVGQYMDVPIDQWGTGKTNPERSSAEVLASSRAVDKKAQRDNPGHYLGGELFGAVMTPGPGKSKALTKLGRFGSTAAKTSGLAGLFGAGASDADWTADGGGTQLAKDAGVSALIGGAASVVPWATGELGQKILAAAKNGSATAIALAKELTKKVADKAAASAQGVKGGAQSAGSHGLDMLDKTIANKYGTLTDDVVAGALAKRKSPTAAALENEVAANATSHLDDKLAGIERAKVLIAEAAEMGTPEALAKAEAEMLSNPILKGVWPRVKKQLIDRLLIPGITTGVGTAAGAAMGSVFGEDGKKWGAGIGTGAGGLGAFVVNAATGGRPSSAFEKMMASPRVQKMLWEYIQKSTTGAQHLGRPVEKLIPLGASKAGSGR